MPTYATNKKARFDYQILETLEVGLVLTGPEVKSIRTGKAKLTGSFVTIHNDEALVTNLHIAKYPYASIQDYVPDRTRTLLLKAREINYLRGKMQEKGLTLVPLSLYTKGRHIKMEIGVGLGKKHYDKRDVIKKRELQRQERRAMKGQFDG